MPSHYEVLKVRVKATEGEIRAAYLALAKQLHPDVNSGPDAASEFLAVKEAYETLSDPDRRRNYDAVLEYSARIARQQEEAAARAAQAEFFRTQAPPREKTPPPEPDSPTPRTDTLRRMMKQGRWKDAEALAREILRTDSRNPWAWAALGEAARIQGQAGEAARHFAFAAQYDPGRVDWVRLHRECLEMADEAEARRREVTEEARGRSVPWLALGFIWPALAAWVVLDRNRLEGAPFFLDGWSIPLVSALIIGGFAAGVVLSTADAIDRFASQSGSGLSRVSPTTVLAGAAVISFWLACGLYLLVGVTQSALNRSHTFLLGSSAALTGLLALAAALSLPGSSLSILIWGGGPAFLASLAGWVAADALRAPRPPGPS
ncbi:MAG: DnaJ domain-containing protein [Fimbriimonadaceae bacterium]|nr:DnaJ domain-containing protein [Fimbriimonadaceae bacterium]